MTIKNLMKVAIAAFLGIAPTLATEEVVKMFDDTKLENPRIIKVPPQKTVQKKL